MLAVVLRVISTIASLIAVVALVSRVRREARQHRDRWGREFVRVPVAAGAFRDAQVTLALARDAPRLVRLAAELGAVLAVLDVMLGAWIAIAVLVRSQGPDMVAATMSLALTGPLFWLAMVLGRDAFALARCEPHALSLPPAADWSLIVHGSMAFAALVLAFLDPPLAVATVAASAAAAIQSAAVRRAVHLVEAARRREGDGEDGASPQ